MGRPKKEIVKKRNLFTLSKEAQILIDSAEKRQKSKIVSEAIVKYLTVCKHEFVPVDANGNESLHTRPNQALYAKCRLCGHKPQAILP